MQVARESRLVNKIWDLNACEQKSCDEAGSWIKCENCVIKQSLWMKCETCVRSNLVSEMRELHAERKHLNQICNLCAKTQLQIKCELEWFSKLANAIWNLINQANLSVLQQTREWNTKTVRWSKTCKWNMKLECVSKLVNEPCDEANLWLKMRNLSVKADVWRTYETWVRKQTCEWHEKCEWVNMCERNMSTTCWSKLVNKYATCVLKQACAWNMEPEHLSKLGDKLWYPSADASVWMKYENCVLKQTCEQNMKPAHLSKFVHQSWRLMA
jgi:hypothetical protein